MSQDDWTKLKTDGLKLGKALFVCFLVFHAFVNVVSNYPTRTALKNELKKPFAFYVRSLHLHKPYNMFYTYDPWYKFDLVVHAKDGLGQIHDLPPILPGLALIEGKGKLRVRVTLQRILKRKNQRLLNSYAQNLCRAIEDKMGHEISELTIEFKTERLRKLALIRKDGVVSEPKNIVKGPFRCKDQ